ncbi:hypothetical protein CDD82_1587 [Ophiocordyceps australis]|uniref:6-methylsalicylate decarboxylase n=1 Tax=Ophiocordyceps australis TaxID=1399860 RepID=A0A2C5XY98_9HYPO|nr:hypothetical protein CDD82_1587 [Ophiocordyceps australis]
MIKKIDVHHHIYPPEMTAVLEAAGGDPSGWDVPAWSLEADDEVAASIGVGTAIFSVTAPGASIIKDNAEAARLAGRLNDYCAKIRDQDPQRYGFFCNLGSLLDTQRCLDEIRRAFDELQADGVVLFTRYGEDKVQYLGHEDFKPIWAELNRRKAVVFIHPTHGLDTRWVNAHAPQPLFDYPHETTRAAADLLMSNNLREFPECKIILSHAGGTLPYLIHRICGLEFSQFGTGKGAAEMYEDAQKFYFDLALAGDERVLTHLMSFAKPGHVLFGSDYPNAPVPAVTAMTGAIDGFDFGDQRDSVYYGAGAALFPRLAKGYQEAAKRPSKGAL